MKTIINFFKINSNLKNKKKGFTLIELVAVMAIIAILSAAFIPRFGNYITQAKKVSILNEAKSIVTAYESVKYKSTTKNENETIGSDLPQIYERNSVAYSRRCLSSIDQSG